MSPNDSLKSGDTDYVLANPGRSYIAYTNSYNSGLGLQNLSGGTYDFLWYDIINNKYVSQVNVNVGSGTQKWSRPPGITGSEVVVYLTNGGIGNTPTPTKQFSPTPTSSVNQPPNALNQTVNTLPGEPIDIQLQFEDDGPGPYTYSITKNPTNGTLSGNSNDRTYSPNSGFTGIDSFQWKVNDSKDDSNIATITINVRDSLVANLSVKDTTNADDWSIQENLQQGTQQYGDRSITFASIPQELLGNTWIQTANDSKSFTGSEIASFTVRGGSTVYIAHDNRINSKPSWLSGWTNTGMSITNSEPRTFTLFSKNYSGNSTVSLGPNGGSPSSMYTVIVSGGGSTTTAGDGNDDGLVDGQDFIIWLTHYGQNVSGVNNGNYNKDSTVDIADYIVWIKNF
jgi:rhamnogalacturonan endolyase